MIDCTEVLFTYDGMPLINDLNFHIEKRSVAALIGPSGAGKSTLFRLLVGLEKPKSGTIQMGGEVSYLMQEEMVLPWRTVLQNLLLPEELAGRDSSERGRELLKIFGLKGWEDRLPSELSGGMLKRMSLAQSVISQKPILLLDEPFSSLDVAMREELYSFLREWQQKHGTTILLITHDFHDAICLADQILLLKKGKIAEKWELGEKDREDPQALARLTQNLRQGLFLS